MAAYHEQQYYLRPFNWRNRNKFPTDPEKKFKYFKTVKGSSRKLIAERVN